ncbi:MAG: site-2 protease family protein [Acidobacteria bacterium]|nr:site-2 protease family protein [Acidobacteriota bacterium]
MDNEVLGLALFSYLIFLFSTVCHEAAHALAAKLGGDPTAYHNGQVSLSPWPHIQQEPFGLGIIPLISFFTSLSSGGLGIIGFASAPFDPYWMLRHPRRAAWMAMAGPAANLVLAGLGVLGLKLGLAAGLMQRGEELAHLATSPNPLVDGAATFLSILFFQNLLLACWNLLPIPPMDGFSAILFVLPERYAAKFLAIRSQVGMVFPILMIGLSGTFWSFFYPVLGFVYRLFF